MVADETSISEQEPILKQPTEDHNYYIWIICNWKHIFHCISPLAKAKTWYLELTMLYSWWLVNSGLQYIQPKWLHCILCCSRVTVLFVFRYLHCTTLASWITLHSAAASLRLSTLKSLALHDAFIINFRKPEASNKAFLQHLITHQSVPVEQLHLVTG